MKVQEVLAIDIFQATQVVAGKDGLQRDVKWVHIIDIPDPLPWIQAGQFMLTTGYAWPRDDQAQQALIRSLAERDLAGIGLAVPRFFEHFSQEACDEADRVSLPLIEIPWDIPFAMLTETVHRTILAEQYRVIEQSEIIHRKLTQTALEGGNLQDLATAFGNLINRAITIEDMDGRILAFHTIESEEDQVRHISMVSGLTPPEVFANLDQIGYLHQMRTTTKPLHIPGLPNIGFKPRVVCPIRLKSGTVGLVWIIEGDRPLSELDMRAAEHAAIVAALHITQQRELNLLESRMGYTFIDALLEGHFESTPHALERASLLGFDPDARYRVGLIILNEPVPLSKEGFLRRESLAESVRRHLRFLNLAPLVSVSLNRISLLFPEKCNGDMIWKLIKDKGVALAFGQVYSGVDGVQKSYREAISLLPYLTTNTCQYYAQLLLPRVLMGDDEARKIFIHTLLGSLKTQRNGDVLSETLLTWARNGFHFASVANIMNIHPKTLQYRLTRAADLLNIDLSDTDIRFQLQLAAHLLELPTTNTSP